MLIFTPFSLIWNTAALVCVVHNKFYKHCMVLLIRVRNVGFGDTSTCCEVEVSISNINVHIIDCKGFKSSFMSI